MIALLFEAKSGEMKKLTPKNGEKFTYPDLQEMLEGNIDIMFLDAFENKIIVINKHCFSGGKHDLVLNEEMTGVFPMPVYGNVLICEEKYLPFETWTTHFVLSENIMYHSFGDDVQVSYNLTTDKRKLFKNGRCIDSVICENNYTADEHCKYLCRLTLDVGKMNSLNH